MRVCGNCSKEDAPWFESAECSCGRQLKGGEPIPALDHAGDCRMIGHDVVRYPVRIAKQDLTFDQKIPAHYARRGWALIQNGQRLYRVKLLCRDCIGLENQAIARHEEYKKACKAARGEQTQSYAQMLASQ